MSSHLSFTVTKVVPPFPPKFGELLTSHTWGADLGEDLTLILHELQNTAILPDYPQHAFVASRFCMRLRVFSYNSEPTKALQVLNSEANILWVVFKRTHDMAAGRAAYLMFVYATAQADDPFARASIAFNQAACAYSLLVVWDDDIASKLVSTASLRADAIALCRDTLSYFEQDRSPTESVRDQISRLHWLLGDLLKQGEAPKDTEIEEALLQFSLATSKAPGDTKRSLRVEESAAFAILKWKRASSSDRSRAKRALKTVVAVSERDRNWSERFNALQALAELAHQDGDLGLRVQYLEKAAARATYELRTALAADALALESGQRYPNALSRAADKHVCVFESLCDAYGERNDAEPALDALETIRGNSLRLWTMPRAELSELQREGAKAIVSASMGQLLGKGHEALDDHALELSGSKRVRRVARICRHKKPALVALSVCAGRATAIITVPTLLRSHSTIRQWTIPGEVATGMARLLGALEPSPLREQRIRRLAELASRAILEPCLPALEGVERVIVSLPSRLIMLPLDPNQALSRSIGLAGEWWKRGSRSRSGHATRTRAA